MKPRLRVAEGAEAGAFGLSNPCLVPNEKTEVTTFERNLDSSLLSRLILAFPIEVGDRRSDGQNLSIFDIPRLTTVHNHASRPTETAYN